MQRIDRRQALCGALASPEERVAALWREGWTPRADVESWPISMPVDWSADPFDDRNWRFQLNAWRPLDILVSAHDATGDDAILRSAADLMLDWERHEQAAPDDGLLWNDMGTGLRACKLAYLLTQPGLAGEAFERDRDRLIELGRRHLARLRDPEFIGTSNHGLFQVHGAAALCRALPDAPESRDGQAYVEQIFTELLHQQFGYEGVHLEHSPDYHHFALKTVRRMFLSGWYEGMPEVHRIIKAARILLRWFIFPDDRMAGLGDSPRSLVHFKPVLKQGYVSRLFKEAGYAIVRNASGCDPSRASMLVVSGGHHSNVHKHADDLSFELFSSGRPVITDTGKYSYSRQAWRDFTDSAAAHNTIDLLTERSDNGVRRSPPVGGMLTQLTGHGWGWSIHGLVTRPEFGVAHQRLFLFRPQSWLVLLDDVSSATVRTFTSWLHLAPGLDVTRSDAGWSFDGGEVTYQSSVEGKTESYHGQVEPRIMGWQAMAYHQRSPRTSLAYEMTGSGARLATVIRLGPGDLPVVRLEPSGFLVDYRGKPIVQPSVPGADSSLPA